ncbi:MAG: NAD-dependent epimerase/dehydratase family protein [Syntrophomonadaceae bacterium]|jgi:UDP-glucose 4-epimerase|nr:NAD-dependent epimerase/dehydratase family protein [Syntrophomonadaceae bacterium]
MKALITGGSGFIGSHIVERLLARGDQVVVIDNYATGRRDNLKEEPNLMIHEATIADEDLLERIFSDFLPEIVVHAAASYKDPDNWAEDARTNVLGTVNVVQACKKFRVERIIYFQTALCYGLHPKEQPITISYPRNPEGSSYAISKTAGEEYIELSGLDYITFRLANAYGPRNISGPLPTFFSRLTTGKPCFVMETRRDFIYVDDLVDCVIKAIDRQGTKGAYHISSGSDYSIKELFDATLRSLNIILDQEVEVRPRGADDAYTILLDPSKTSKVFDWAVSTPLETGVKKAVDYYKEFGITQTFTHLRQPDEK